MIRHIFLGTFKDGVSGEDKQKVLDAMRAMKEEIPSIAEQQVGFSTGWAGQGNQIVMTVDFQTKGDFDAFLSHPYHTDHVNRLGMEYCEISSFVAAQFEF